jgi:replication factor A1
MNVDIVFKVASKNEPRETREGIQVTEALVGDPTGSILMTLWRETIDQVEVGKTYHLINGYTNIFKGSMRLTLGREGKLEPSKEDIGEVNTENNISDKEYPQERRPFRERTWRRY